MVICVVSVRDKWVGWVRWVMVVGLMGLGVQKFDGVGAGRINWPGVFSVPCWGSFPTLILKG